MYVPLIAGAVPPLRSMKVECAWGPLRSESQFWKGENCRFVAKTLNIFSITIWDGAAGKSYDTKMKAWAPGAPPGMEVALASSYHTELTLFYLLAVSFHHPKVDC
jgi:hypothetical protein